MGQQFFAVVCPSLVLGGKELPLIATIKFTHCPARAATPPSYASGGDPPEPEGVEDVVVTKLTADPPGEPLECPAWLSDAIAEMVETETLLEAVDLGPDPDDLRDRMRDRESDRQAFFDGQNTEGD